MTYRGRNRVERLFVRLDESRRVVTRYDEEERMSRIWVHLIPGFIRLRIRTNADSA